MEEEGRFETCPYVGQGKERERRSVRFIEEGQFPNRANVGATRQVVDGQPQGLRLRRRHVGRDVDREEEGRVREPAPTWESPDKS